MDYIEHRTEVENFEIFVDKDIYKTSVTKKMDYRLSSVPSSERNPLFTLNDNVPIRSKTVHNKRVNTEEKKFRTKSTGGVVMKLEYEFDQRIETVTTVHTKNVCPEQGASAAKIGPPVPKKPKQPSKKITLARKLHKRYIGTLELFSNCLYGVEYFKDNYNYIVGIEGKYVFRRNHLKEFINHEQRLFTVNWLIQVQQCLNLSDITLFTSVRMMDYFLIKIKIPAANYYLIGITCMWISSKIHDVYLVVASKLSFLCNGKYSKAEVIEMEKKILRTFQFDVNYLEPTSFLFYYMNSLNLQKNDKVLFGALFLLEIFLFLMDFSSSAPSLLAAVAIYLSLQKFDVPSCDEFQKSHFCDSGTFKRFSQYMNKCVKEVLATKCFANEAVKKYSLQAKLNIAQFFTTD